MPSTAYEPVKRNTSSACHERVRLLHVIDSLKIGGAEQLLVTLAGYIDASRFDMRVCSLSPDDGEAPISVALGAHGIPVYRPSHLRRHDLRHLRWLTTLVRREAIDLVHTHLPYGNVIGLAAAAASQRPAVSTVHNVRDRHRGLPTGKQWLQGAALRRRARVVIACSPEVEVSARRRFKVSPDKLVVVPNGIEAAAYGRCDPQAARVRRAELLHGLRGPLVLAVGRLSPQKGHEHLVKATARLVDRFPELCVVIAGGDGDAAVLVRERIATHGLQDRIRLAGEIGDVRPTLLAADLFVHPSLWEGLPLALMEAMAAGVPVVASAVGGTPAAVDHGRVARLVAPGDPDALAEAMAEVLVDPVGARKLAKQARTYVSERYAAEAWARALEGIYAGVLASPASRSSS